MFKKLSLGFKELVIAAYANTLIALPAMAATNIPGLGDVKTAEDLNKASWMIGNEYILPAAFGVIFVMVLVVSVMMATSATNPDKNTIANLALGRLAKAALIAIFATTIIGVALGIYNKVNK